MAIRQIRVLGDDVLRKKCKEVKEMTPVSQLALLSPDNPYNRLRTVLNVHVYLKFM